MDIHQVINSLFNSCSYVISSDHSSWLIDCGDVDRILPHIDGRLCGVLLTHAHFDHIYGLNHLLALFPDVPIYVNGAARDALLSDNLNLSRYVGLPMTLDADACIRVVADGQSVNLFDGIDARAVYTPGHNPGSVTWVIEDMVFTGDSCPSPTRRRLLKAKYSSAGWLRIVRFTRATRLRKKTINNNTRL